MSDIVVTFTWWFLVQIFGLSALPLAFRLFRRLPDRGYGVSKALGLLLTGYLFWLLGILGFLRNDSGSILLSLVTVAIASLLFYSRLPRRSTPEPSHATRNTQYVTLSSWLRANWRLVLLTELVFALAFGGWVLYRAYVPRIMTAGGEKFMELAFLNSLNRSATLPPPDPWLSDFAISYYYFGYLIMSMLIRLSGVAPSVGFNLGGALLFALTATGAFSLVYNLVASLRPAATRSGSAGEARRSPWAWRVIAVALLGMTFVVFLSNYEAPLEVAHWQGLGSAEFWEWLDIADLDRPPPGPQARQEAPGRLVRPVTGPGWGWWWRASRVIFDYNLPDWPNRYDEEAIPSPHRRENIDEFPFFSFLLGDMHPHVLSLPFFLLALTASLALFRLGGRTLGRAEWVLLALIYGALGFLNTWDLPIQWAVAVGALALGRTAGRLSDLCAHLRPIFNVAVTLGFGSLLLYLPFYLGFQSQASGLLAHVHSSTRMAHFGVMFGPLLLILLCFLAWGIWRAWRRGTLALRAGLLTMAVLLLLALAVLLATALVIQLSPRVRELVVGGPSDAAPFTIARHYLSMRLGAPWVTVLLAGMIGAAVMLLCSPGLGRLAQFSLLLVAAGAVMTLAPEYVYLKDIFGVRMNTIFKFYYQAWILWAVASAGAVYVMLVDEEGLRPAARGLLGGGLALVVGLGLLYPLLAIPDRVQEFPEAPTLDGTAYLATEHPGDYAAVQWLNTHVEGSSVILETPGGAYEYNGRVSAQTGLPTLLGWAGHEHQWRGNTVEQNKRQPVFEALCQTTDLQRTLTLLDEYDITYVYVGPLEQSKCPAAGLKKFDQLMDVVYDRDGVTIYQRRGGRAILSLSKD